MKTKVKRHSRKLSPAEEGEEAWRLEVKRAQLLKRFDDIVREIDQDYESSITFTPGEYKRLRRNVDYLDRMVEEIKVYQKK